MDFNSLWQAAHCPLHTANAPESEHLHFILHIEQCTLHTACLYCIVQIYHFTLRTSKKFPVLDSTLTWRNMPRYNVNRPISCSQKCQICFKHFPILPGLSQSYSPGNCFSLIVLSVGDHCFFSVRLGVTTKSAN